ADRTLRYTDCVTAQEGGAVERETGTFRGKSGLAEMLKGGVIMDVTTAEQARIAEEAGAGAVMALERVPADIRAEGGVARLSAGGIATPADAALMMQLGAEGNFVGSGIFKSDDPAPRARAIVEATTYFNDPDVLAKVSTGLGEPMRGQEISQLAEKLQTRGW